VARKQDLPTKPLLTRPDHLRKFYGANLAEVFRTPAYDCSLKNECGVPDFALTRLKGDRWRCSGRRPILKTAPCSSAWL
jgi:hypothetical protein